MIEAGSNLKFDFLYIVLSFIDLLNFLSFTYFGLIVFIAVHDM